MYCFDCEKPSIYTGFSLDYYIATPTKNRG